MSINSYVVKGTAAGALGGLLFGFDTAVISGTTRALTSVYHLSPFMLGVTVSSALLGTVVAALGAGIPGQRYGRRASLRLMALFYLISALGCAFAWNWPVLIVFRFVGGLGIGGSSVLGPMYIAEIAPPKWRGRLVGCFQINVVVGILLAYLSNYIIASQHLGAAEWRWQLGVSGIPALLFLLTLFGIPRSPRWLVMQRHLDEAAAVLRRAGVPDVPAQIAEILESVQLEKVAAKERLFSRKYAKPLFLAITVGMFCQLSGINAILYYLNDIFALAGASTMSGNLQAVAVGAMNLVATLAAMAVIDHIGRRRLLLVGTSGLVVTLAAVSVIFYTHQHMNWLVWLLLAYIACFAISQGAVIWVYVSEVFPNRVRSKGQSVGSSAHWITNAVIALVFPIMATTSGAYPFIFFTVMMVLDLFIIAIYYPETTGISLEQVQHEFGIR